MKIENKHTLHMYTAKHTYVANKHMYVHTLWCSSVYIEFNHYTTTYFIHYAMYDHDIKSLTMLLMWYIDVIPCKFNLSNCCNWNDYITYKGGKSHMHIDMVSYM